MSPTQPVVFFDLQAIGRVVGHPDHGAIREIQVYPGLRPRLERLRQTARLGILATGGGVSRDEIERLLADAGLIDLFDRSLLFYAATDSPTFFDFAVEKAGHGTDPESCLLVSADSERRTIGLDAGLRVSPHPALAEAVLAGQDLTYVRITHPQRQMSASWRALLQDVPLVPVHIVAAAPTAKMLAVAAVPAIAMLQSRGMQVQRIGTPDEVATTSLYLLYDIGEGAAASAFRTRLESVLPLLFQSEDGLIAAIPATRSVDEFHPPTGAHGHSIELRPGLSLLSSSAAAQSAPPAPLTADETQALQALTTELYRAKLEPWCGPGTAPGEQPIRSRHIQHPDNGVAVRRAAQALKVLLGEDHVHLHPYRQKGIDLNCIEAEITGSEDSHEVVIVGAHIDSTAMFTPGYEGNEATALAPGADDDASGMAAILAVAEVLRSMSAVALPRRSIRLLLFNSEEVGMVGSFKYASEQSALGTKVVAMLQMDMIGYPTAPYPPSAQYEIHAAGKDDFQEPMSEPTMDLARLVLRCGQLVSPNLQPQIFPLDGCGSSPAAWRSDHRQFLIHGFPACLVSEDLFSDTCQPVQGGNPEYHKDTDTIEKVNCRYAADIARIVAAAAWAKANA